MYQALYRKWRPHIFDDVVGQEHITRTLKNEVETGKLSHAYLFTGSRGTGKTTCSKIVAKAVNCAQTENGNPCNVCAICKGIDEGSILDVVEIDAASNNGVDNIRELREEAGFTPAVAKYRVYILDECHMLSQGAVNALLKILEEPPAHVIFILATTEVHKVLPTILSRCQRFDFKRIRARVIADRLLYVCEQEQVSLVDDAAMLIARLSDGGMRDALSLLDLCVSRGEEITVRLVNEVAGLGGQSQLFTLIDAVLAKKPAETLQVLDALSENSVDFTRLCEQLIGHCRNLMLVKTIDDPDELISGTPEELQWLREQGKKISLPRILFALELLQDTMGRLSRTAFKRTELEMALVRLCDERLGSGLEEVYKRLDQLEHTAAHGGFSAAVPVAQPEPSGGLTTAQEPEPRRKPVVPPPSPVVAQKTALAAEQPASGSSSGGPTAVEPFDEWPQVLSSLKKRNGALYGAMSDSCAYTSGDLMLIDCKNDMFLTLLRTSMAAKESLREAISTVTGRKYNMGPYNPEKHAPAASQTSDPLTRILQKASELSVPVEIQE